MPIFEVVLESFIDMNHELVGHADRLGGGGIGVFGVLLRGQRRTSLLDL